MFVEFLIWPTCSVSILHFRDAKKCTCTWTSLAGHVEWFCPAPRLSAASPDAGPSPSKSTAKYRNLLKRHRSADSETSDEDDNDADVSDDESDLGFVSRSKRMLRHGLYYLTDMERFQPPRKRPRLVTRTYRLLCLKSTTPEELFRRLVTS